MKALFINKSLKKPKLAKRISPISYEEKLKWDNNTDKTGV